jgi:hypothetical protein
VILFEINKLLPYAKPAFHIILAIAMLSDTIMLGIH